MLPHHVFLDHSGVIAVGGGVECPDAFLQEYFVDLPGKERQGKK